jgi:hypothetical protein
MLTYWIVLFITKIAVVFSLEVAECTRKLLRQSIPKQVLGYHLMNGTHGSFSPGKRCSTRACIVLWSYHKADVSPPFIRRVEQASPEKNHSDNDMTRFTKLHVHHLMLNLGESYTLKFGWVVNLVKSSIKEPEPCQWQGVAYSYWNLRNMYNSHLQSSHPSPPGSPQAQIHLCHKSAATCREREL